MREIKFRIWNSHGQCMHEWPELVEKNKIHLLNAKNPTYTVMQFTGLQDSQGVDIYEGDIVMAYHREYGQHSVAEVGFDLGTFTMGRYWKDGIHDWIPMGEYEALGLEVIGDIHQNQDLLEKQTK